MKDFFISYNKADRERAEWIASQLVEAGYTVFLQAWDIRPGSNFVLEMQRAAEEAERTIAVLSPDYLTASFTLPELAAAFAQDPTGKKGTLVPVRVRECETKGLLRSIVYIDLVDLDEAAAKRTLLKGLKRGSVRPDESPEYRASTSRTTNATESPAVATPSVWNVTHLRNPNFTGREDELAQLRASLLAGEMTALVQARAIHGLGGVGKTQLAVEYAYRHRADYEIVWWVRSEEPTTLASEYAGLAARLNLPEKDTAEQRLIVEAVKEWLRRNRGWLLVFDNAEDVQLVREYIPRGSAGHIIVISRNPNWTGAATPLSVKALPLEEAIEFLFKRTGHEDSATAKLLAEALGRLPLALEQAGAYIEASQCTMTHYLEMFESRQRELLERGKPSTEYPDTVATTWSLSFHNVEDESPAAAELLRLCAFFAPDDIPIKLLVAGATEMPESLTATASDALLLDEALMALRKYSMVDVDKEAICIHRLVQAVIRYSMNEDAFRLWSAVAVNIVNTSFPFDGNNVRTWPNCKRLKPHALAALNRAAEALSSRRRTEVPLAETMRLLNRVRLYLIARQEYLVRLRERGDLVGTKSIYELGLAIGERLGANHPEVAIRLNNLGDVLRDQGDLAGATAHYERALRVFQESLGDDHPDTRRVEKKLRLLEELKNAK